MKIESENIKLSSSQTADFLKKTCEKGMAFKFTAKGMSMSPFICDGDAILIEPFMEKRPAIGEIVAFVEPSGGHLIVHRVIKKQGGRYLLKGDNICTCDGYCEKDDIHGYIKKIIIPAKQFHNSHKTIRNFFLFSYNSKRIIAILSRYKLLTPFCRLANKLL